MNFPTRQIIAFRGSSTVPPLFHHATAVSYLRVSPMLFETEIPGWDLSKHKKTLASPVLTTGNCERMSKLPR